MFKGFKLRQMAVVANQVLSENMEVFNQYGTDVSIETQSALRQIERIKGVEHIAPMHWTGSSHMGPKGRTKLHHIRTVTFCMNSMYIIAKTLKKDPEYFVAEVIEKFCDDVRNGIYPDNDSFCVPEHVVYATNKKAI